VSKTLRHLNMTSHHIQNIDYTVLEFVKKKIREISSLKIREILLGDAEQRAG
jgi:hypothetical protein